LARDDHERGASEAYRPHPRAFGFEAGDGFSHRPHHKATRGRQPVQVVKAVEAPSYDLTLLSG
jgi:hypothetical protein